MARGVAGALSTPHMGVEIVGSNIPVLTGAYSSGTTNTSADFRWASSLSAGTGGQFIASTVDGASWATGTYGTLAYNSQVYNGIDYGTVTVTGLTTGFTYTFYVQIIDSNGSSGSTVIQVTPGV